MTVPLVAEASTHGRRPVVLYKFMFSADEGFPSPPASPGALVGVAPLIQYTQVRDLGQTSVGLCPPTSPDSAICGPFSEIGFGSGVTVWSAYHGGISGTGAYFFARYDLNALLGLLPDRDYVIRMLARKLGGASVHITGIRVDNENGSVAVNGASSSWAYYDFPVTSGPTGELLAEVGGFDMTVGAAVVTGLAFLAVYDAEDIPAGTPGLPQTQYNRTSFRRSVTYQSATYTPAEIEHTEPSQGTEDASGTVQITLPADDPVAVEFQSSIPPQNAMVAIYEYHRPPVDEPDEENVWKTLYDIISAEDTIHGMVLTCMSLLGQGDMIIPSGLIQRDLCDFSTYHPETCGVNPNLFTFEGVVSSIVGLSVTVAGAAAFNPDTSYFKLGDFANGSKHTMIREQFGDVMLLDEMIPGLLVGDAVTLLAGDDRTKETCHFKFGNSARRRSFPHLPVVNPYYGQGLRP